MLVESFNGLTLNGGAGKYETYLSGRLPYGLPPVQVQMLARTGRFPRFAGLTRGQVTLKLDIYIRTGGSSTELSSYFDNEDETPATLTVTDADGSSNPRTVQAVCVGLAEEPLSAGKHFEALFVVDGDPYWRKLASTVTWTSVGDGETNVITNNGDMDAYPTQIQVFPTSAKTGYVYRRWVKVKWTALYQATAYPTDVCGASFDTSALVGAGKMQADGDDLRVWVDGVEVDRWLSGINTTQTKAFVNLDWQKPRYGVVETAIAGAGSISTIVSSSTITGFPAAGILEIGSEIFTYTGKNNYTKTFTGVTRAQRGSSAAAHAVGDIITWIQHDIFILYGNGSATAPSVDSNKEPLFTLASSSNSLWTFANFNTSTGRAWGWTYEALGTANKYTADRGTNANTYSEMGINLGYSIGASWGRWKFYNPCQLSNANFSNGEKYTETRVSGWQAEIQSSVNGVDWQTEDTIAEPTADATWQSWSDNEALAGSPKWVGLYLAPTGGTLTIEQILRLEVADVTLTIVSGPTITIGSETANYDLDCTLTNEDTGEAIRLTFPFLTTSVGAVEVNTDEHFVFEYENDRLIFSALELVGGPRKHWFRLQPGDNTIRYNENGATNCVTLSWIFYERFYE